MDKIIKCWNCKSTIESKDSYCRYCGKGQGQTVPFQYTHIGIIILTLLLGPITLPFIWKSPIIDKKSRIVYIIINLIITLIMLSLFFDMYSNVNQQVKEIMKIIE